MVSKKEDMFVHSRETDYQTIFDSSPNMIIYKDLSGVVLDANKSYLEFLGVPKSKVIGKSTAELLVDPAVAAKTLADDMEVIKSGKPKLRQIRKFVSPFSKREIWGMFSKVPHRDEKGNIVGTISFVVDVTERVAAEEKLRQAQDYFGRLLQSLPLIVSEVDAEGKFLFWNKYAERTLGYAAEEVVGKLSYLSLQESKEKYEQIRDVIAKTGKYDGEASLRRKDGTLVLMHLVLIPSADYVRGQGGFYGYAEDITQRRAGEEEIKKLNSLMVGREVKMVELKVKIRELEEIIKKMDGGKNFGGERK